MRSGVTDLGITIKFLCMGNRIRTCEQRGQVRPYTSSSTLSSHLISHTRHPEKETPELHSEETEAQR